MAKKKGKTAFRLTYEQREVRSCWIEADTLEAALAEVRRLADAIRSGDRGGFPAGEFEHADGGRPLLLRDQSGEVVNDFPGAEWDAPKEQSEDGEDADA